MAREDEYSTIKKYLDNAIELTLDQRLLKILMNRPNINYQTIEMYFDRDPDYRLTYANLKKALIK